MSDLAGSTVPVQQESIQFNQPVSEASLAGIGAVANFLLSIQPPVGTIWSSMLNETQFQAQIGNPSPATWVLADGRSVVGSAYQAVTSSANIPDLRGIFLRGSNNGGSAAGTRSDGGQNPDGTLAPGSFTFSKFASHTHTPTSGSGQAYVGNGNVAITITGSAIAIVENGYPLIIDSTGGNETAPSNVTINWFIRIN